MSNHWAAVPILTHAAAMITASAAEDWKLHSLKAHESLTNIIVGGRVNGATLSIAEEFVKCVVSSTFPNLVVVVQLLSLVDGIVHRAVCGVLRRAAIEASRSTSRMLLAISTIWTKRTIRILISTRCSGKRLQVSDQFAVLARVASSSVRSATVGLGRAEENRVIGVSLDVLLEILRALECLATEVAFMRLQRNVNTDVGGDVITFDSGCAAVTPLARQIQVVGALATNVTFANVIVELLSGGQSLAAALPLAHELIAG